MVESSVSASFLFRTAATPLCMVVALLAYSRYDIWIIEGDVTDKEGSECEGLGVEHHQALF